jgi:Xaa-Pro dipeptidase
MLPRATFVNAEPALWQLRLVKSPEEVSRLRVAARAVSRAAEAAFRSARAGMTELEMERIILRSVVEDGCRPYSVELAFGPKGAYSVAPTSNCLQPGQIMRVDVTAFYKGYVADISRVAAFGIVGDRAERAHRAILHANQALQNAVRPGITGAELRMLEMDTFGQEGLAPLIPMAGHGVGRVVHEFPFLTEADHTRLQPGITVTIEPSIRLHGVGSVNIEDTVVVTQSGVECLTTAARGLYDYA